MTRWKRTEARIKITDFFNPVIRKFTLELRWSIFVCCSNKPGNSKPSGEQS